MKYITFFLLYLFSNQLYSQYSVVAYQDSYNEIEDFNSMALETMGAFYWGKEFLLGFDFPFFDEKFDKLDCDWTGTCSFEGDLDLSLRLMVFGYEFDNVLDTVDIQSDVRYKLGTQEGKQYLAVQYTKCRLVSDPAVEQYDSYVNFQYWLFEDGNIELRFGKSNIDNSPVYVPGEGFYFFHSNIEPMNFGPQLALYHPYDKSIRLEYNDLDSHEQYELNADGTGSIDWWPPEGWVIRFSNLLVSNTDSETHSPLRIYPNPTSDLLRVESNDKILNIEVYAMDGCKVAQGVQSTIDLTNLREGLYHVHIQTDKSITNHKIIKQ